MTAWHLWRFRDRRGDPVGDNRANILEAVKSLCNAMALTCAQQPDNGLLLTFCQRAPPPIRQLETIEHTVGHNKDFPAQMPSVGKWHSPCTLFGAVQQQARQHD